MSLSDRNQAVDALRAVALIGICVVNVPFMALPIADVLSTPEATVDRAVVFAVETFFQAKFFLLFSLLLGWGIEIQSRAAERAGVRFARRYGRRLAALAGLGALHAVLVFSGDILLLYALLGALAWPLRRLPPRRLLQTAAAMVPVAALSVLAIVLAFPAMPDPTAGPGLGGSYPETVAARFGDWPATFVFLVLFQGHLAFAAILAGIAGARTGFFDGGGDGPRRLRRAEPWLLALGLVCNLLYGLGTSAASGPDPGILVLGIVMIAVGGPALSAVYLSLVLRLASARPLPAVVVLAGRNSLSVYVLQGVLAGFVFGGYGLGLFGRLSFTALLPVSLAIALAAMLAVGLTARHFGRGPLEMVLRRATYG